MRMSPSEWCGLAGKQYSLSKIAYTKLIPDQRRCRVTAHDVHCSWNRNGVNGPEWTLEEAEAYEALVVAAQQRVIDRYYGGMITEKDDYHSDDDDEEEGEEEEGWESEGEGEESEGEGEESEGEE